MSPICTPRSCPLESMKLSGNAAESVVLATHVLVPLLMYTIRVELAAMMSLHPSPSTSANCAPWLFVPSLSLRGSVQPLALLPGTSHLMPLLRVICEVLDDMIQSARASHVVSTTRLPRSAPFESVKSPMVW